MMIKISNKGSSDYLKEGIISYVIFIMFLGILVSFGAGAYITSDTITDPPVPTAPTGDWFTDLVGGISWPIENIVYFFDLMGKSFNLQIFTGIILTPFLILVLMYIVETVRGN